MADRNAQPEAWTSLGFDQLEREPLRMGTTTSSAGSSVADIKASMRKLLEQVGPPRVIVIMPDGAFYAGSPEEMRDLLACRFGPSGFLIKGADHRSPLSPPATNPIDQGRFRVMLNDSSDEHFPDWLFQRSFQTEPEAEAWAKEQMKTGRWFGWEVIEVPKEAGHG